MYRSRFPNDPGMHNVGSIHNENNHYSRVSNKKNPTLLERISETFAGALLGLGIFAVSFFILFANEGRAVQTTRSLEECLSLVVPVENSQVIFQENNNKLVHVTGRLRTDQAIKDGYTGAEVQAVKLRREVQMFQWIEHQRTSEVTEGHQKRTHTDFMYTKEWKSHLVSSDLYNNPVRHQNQREFSVRPTTYVATHAYLGSYYLKEGIKSKIETFHPLTPDAELTSPEVKYVDGMYYTGSPRMPQIGDIRISYSYAGLSGAHDYHVGPPEVVSIIAKQSASALTKYKTDAGDDLDLLHYGKKTAQEMISDEIAANTALTWMLRAGGWFMMFMGLYLMTRIINLLVSWIPLVRTLISFGLTVFNLFISFTLSLVVISVAWFFYRPLIATVLLAVGLTPTVIVYFRGQQLKSTIQTWR